MAFFKVENDGYDLGAQRRPIGKDDLPAVTDEVNEYLRRLRAGETLDDFEPQTGLLADKDWIADDGDYNLSGERYREREQNGIRLAYPLVADIGDVIVETITPPLKIHSRLRLLQLAVFQSFDQSQNDIAGWTDDDSAVNPPYEAASDFWGPHLRHKIY